MRKVEYKLARARARDRHDLPPGSVAVAGPEGVLAEARLVTTEGHSRWAPACRRSPAGGPRSRRLCPRPLRRHHRAGLVHWAADRPGERAGPRPREWAPLRRPVDTRRSRRRGGRLLGDGRGPRRTPSGARLYSGVYDSDGGLHRPREVGPAGRGAGGAARGDGVRRDPGARAPRGDPAAVPGAVFPASAEFLAAPLAAAALRLAASGATVSASGLRPLYLRGRRRPPLVGVSSGCFLRRALLADVPAIAALEAACFTHPWTPAQSPPGGRPRRARHWCSCSRGRGPRAGLQPGYAPIAPPPRRGRDARDEPGRRSGLPEAGSRAPAAGLRDGARGAGGCATGTPGAAGREPGSPRALRVARLRARLGAPRVLRPADGGMR